MALKKKKEGGSGRGGEGKKEREKKKAFALLCSTLTLFFFSSSLSRPTLLLSPRRARALSSSSFLLSSLCFYIFSCSQKDKTSIAASSTAPPRPEGSASGSTPLPSLPFGTRAFSDKRKEPPSSRHGRGGTQCRRRRLARP